MSGVLRDLRFALRQLRGNPGFTSAAVLILALGIGINSAVFSVVNAALFRPLPVEAPEDLVALYRSTPQDFMATSALSTADYLDLVERSRGFSQILAYTYNPVAVEYHGHYRLVLGVRTSPNFFSVLGVKPFRGRFFGPAKESEGTEVVLSYAAWQRRYGAADDVLGDSLLLDGRPATIVGIAPQEFLGLTRGVTPELWTALPGLVAGRARPQGEGLGWLWAMGRRAPSATLRSVQADLGTLAARLTAEDPKGCPPRTFLGFPANSVRILPEVDARLGTASAVVLGLVGLVLLIACSNVANLLLARAIARRREIATRRALGASEAAVVRQLLLESVCLALGGGGLGLGLTLASNAALGALRLPLPIDLDLGLAIDVRVVLFTLGAASLTALVFGLVPALAAARRDLAPVLRGGPATAGDRSQSGGSKLLVVAQVALSLVLLIDTGLAVRSLRNAHAVDPGFTPRGVVVAAFGSPVPGAGGAETEEFFTHLTERARALPTVESAALTSHLPLRIEITFDRVATATTRTPTDRWPTVDRALIGPGYMETLGIPLLRGRSFGKRDRADSLPVAVVNQTFATQFWPGEEAVGQRVQVEGAPSPFEVVGVVRDGKYRTLGEAPRPFLYLALAQQGWREGGHTGEITSGSRTLVARARGPAGATLASLRDIAREIDPRATPVRLETLEESLGVAFFLPRLAARLFLVFGLLGLALASLGIYSLIAYSVSLRRREIGIRLALGATRGDIFRHIVGRGMGAALVGIGAGLVVATGTTHTLTAALYGVSPLDPGTFATLSIVVALVALAASLVPARQAATGDPLSALRDE